MSIGLHNLYLIISLGLIFFFLFIFLVSYIRGKTKRTIYSDADFTVSIAAMNTLIESYDDRIFGPKITQLQTQFDLDVDSKTNASQTFASQSQQVLGEAARDVLENYLSNNLKRTLLQYFTVEGLLLIIITRLNKR